MFRSRRLFCEKVNLFAKVDNAKLVVRYCKDVSRSKANVPTTSQANVIIPPRIKRGPTDILKATCITSGTQCDNYSKQENYLCIGDVMKYCVKAYQSLVKISNGLNDKSGKNGLAQNILSTALASTVETDFTAYEYKYPDDPFFYPKSSFYKKVLALSLESGRKSAKWIVDNNPAFFKHPLSEPCVEAFLPKIVETVQSKPTEKTLINAINQRNISEAIKVFQTLEMENLEVSHSTKQCLLELVCFYNSEPISNDDLESRWFSDPDLELMNTWKNKNFAEELFVKMNSNCPLAYSAIIQGMFKYNEVVKAKAYFEEARVKKIKLSVGAYNAFISKSYIFEKKTSVVSFLNKILSGMAQENIMPNLGTLNASLEALDKSDNFSPKPEVALQILQEFKNVGIEPSIGSYGVIFFIIAKSKGREKLHGKFVEKIMNSIEKKEHEILHPSDLNFFLNSITAFYIMKSDLVLKLDSMLWKNNNFKFIPSYFHQTVYTRKLLSYIFKRKPIDFAMKMYRKNFTLASPGVKLYKMILDVISENHSPEYLTEIWEDMKKSNFLKNRAATRHVFSLIQNFTDESSLKVFHEAAIGFLDKSTSTDILDENIISVSNLLMVFVKNDDEKNLLKVLNLFRENSALIYLEDITWEILFEYAVNKINVELIPCLLALASEAEYSQTSKMAEKALPVLNVQDAARARELIDEKTKF